MIGTQKKRPVYIGCASGFWGDSQIAVPQLLTADRLDYIVFDYLAETTMSILQRARMRNPELGYATDFVSAVIRPHLKSLLARGVRLVSNAGGLNPEKCRDAIQAIAREQGLEPSIAIVTGDDVMALAPHFRDDLSDESDGRPCAVPEPLLSANAYLGAMPITEALRRGADIVITGRAVDSASVLGIAAHEYDWSFTDLDRLAQASLAGHLIECGPQATGGLFTDWEAVPDWANIGYPIVAIDEDGSFALGKPPRTGGLINHATVAEQLLYEIGDPSAYALPDVTCDFRQVTITETGANQVKVCGARGRPPSAKYKVTATFHDGFQLALMMAIRGQRASAKAKRTADELLRRTRTQLQAGGFSDYTGIVVELLGTESMYGPHAQDCTSREVVLRIAAQHPDRKALEFLQKESTSAGTSMGPGTRSHFGGRSDIQAVIKTASFYIAKRRVPVRLQCAGREDVMPASIEFVPQPQASDLPDAERNQSASLSTRSVQTVRVPLSRLAYARSGDKGDDANIGVIARHARFLPILMQELTAARVREHFAHLVEGDVARFELPGTGALNFLLRRALGGGGSSSLRSDPLGKSYAQLLLDLQVACPAGLLGH